MCFVKLFLCNFWLLHMCYYMKADDYVQIFNATSFISTESREKLGQPDAINNTLQLSSQESFEDANGEDEISQPYESILDEDSYSNKDRESFQNFDKLNDGRPLKNDNLIFSNKAVSNSNGNSVINDISDYRMSEIDYPYDSLYKLKIAPKQAYSIVKDSKNQPSKITNTSSEIDFALEVITSIYITKGSHYDSNNPYLMKSLLTLISIIKKTILTYNIYNCIEKEQTFMKLISAFKNVHQVVCKNQMTSSMNNKEHNMKLSSRRNALLATLYNITKRTIDTYSSSESSSKEN